MAKIIPLKGTLYNNDKIKDLSKVMAPPYDVISSEEQDNLYNSNPHNIIRILLGKDSPGDNEKENRYIRASRFLKDWQKEEVLKRDKEESFYVYLQEFEVDGQNKKRLGFIGLLKLEDFDTEKTSVYPHENTLSAPKEDRARLINSIEANIGPIFAIFADEDKSVNNILFQATESQPLIDILDHHGIKNKLWRLSDKDTVEKIVNLMKDKKMFIADGHHRYEVGLAYSKLKKDPKFGYILTYFTDIYDDGIVVLPVHRLIKGVDSEGVSTLEKDLKGKFDIETVGSKDAAKRFLSGATPSEKRFITYYNKKFIGLKLKGKNTLDVNVLHDLIIEPLKSRVEQGEAKISIDFTKDMDYAIRGVDSGRFALAIMLNPTKITEIHDKALSGKRMPQKSTYFYPKVLTGLVLNVF